jgi:hypothetical protein
MKRTIGMESRSEPVTADTRSLSYDRFEAFVPFRNIIAFEKLGNSELP